MPEAGQPAVWDVSAATFKFCRVITQSDRETGTFEVSNHNFLFSCIPQHRHILLADLKQPRIPAGLPPTPIRLVRWLTAHEVSYGLLANTVPCRLHGRCQLPHVCPAAGTNDDAAGAGRLREACRAPICICGTSVTGLSRCGVLETVRRSVRNGRSREIVQMPAP